MIRIDLTSPPLVWQDVRVPVDGELQALRVRYAILNKGEVDARSRRRLELAVAVKSGDELQALTDILERLSAEEVERMRADLRAAVREWELADPAGNPIPVTPQTLEAVLDYGIYLLPLYDGLLEASNGARAKNS